jgi:uncharacterized membrane protein YeaQ/YmgE (transglycosylase-associated protein family)
MTMNILIWALAGAALGWLSFSYLGFSEGRGRFASLVIGAVAGILGGKVIAPMLSAPALVPTDFTTSSLVIAMVVASVVLFAANMVYKRWDV